MEVYVLSRETECGCGGEWVNSVHETLEGAQARAQYLTYDPDTNEDIPLEWQSPDWQLHEVTTWVGQSDDSTWAIRKYGVQRVEVK